MNDRKREKIGWIVGWLGGFIWVLILSIIFFAQGKIMHSCLGLLVTCIAIVVILFFSPWRHPRVLYRRLMVPIYSLFFMAVAWGVWALGDIRVLGINSWWAILILLPILTPFWTVGNRRWEGNRRWDDHDA